MVKRRVAQAECTEELAADEWGATPIPGFGT